MILESNEGFILFDLSFTEPSLDPLIYGSVEELISLNFHLYFPVGFYLIVEFFSVLKYY